MLDLQRCMPQNFITTLCTVQLAKKSSDVGTLQGHSHENDFKIITLNDRVGPNKGTPTLFKFLKLPITLLRF
jgi:hypothetical protein